jgi:hypothetical protein
MNKVKLEQANKLIFIFVKQENVISVLPRPDRSRIA